MGGCLSSEESLLRVSKPVNVFYLWSRLEEEDHMVSLFSVNGNMHGVKKQYGFYFVHLGLKEFCCEDLWQAIDRLDEYVASVESAVGRGYLVDQ